MNVDITSPVTYSYKSADSFGRVVTNSYVTFDKAVRASFYRVLTILFWRIVSRTPVYTGRLRSNWQYGTSLNNRMAPGKFTRRRKISNNPPGLLSIDIDDKLSVPKSGSDQYFIFNNTKYVLDIENGIDSQGRPLKSSPNGMMMISLVDFSDFSKRVLKYVKLWK
jgi:hypothetical protein